MSMVECKLCGEYFKTITNSHLRNRHSMTVDEYKSLFALERVSPEGWSTGEKNSFYGKKHSEKSKVFSNEYRNNASLRRKGKLPHEFLVNVSPEEYHNKLSKALSGCGNGMFGKEVSEERKEQLKIEYVGEGNPNWRGGIAHIKYSKLFLEIIRYEIRNREEHKCFMCGLSEVENFRNLDVHHIDYDNSLDNLVALCQKCHLKTNGRRFYWTEVLHEEIYRHYGNQQLSQSNGWNGRLESSETTELRNPTNNILHERPTSQVDEDIVRLSLETVR